MTDSNKISNLPQLFNSIDWEGKISLSHLLRGIIFQALQVVVGDKSKLDFDSVKIEHPKVDNYGDYSTNVALILAQKVGMKPLELANKLAEELNKYIRQYQSTSTVSDSLSHQDDTKSLSITEIDPKTVGEIVENASVAGPGFVNLTIRKDYLSSGVAELLKKDYGSVTTLNMIEKADAPLTGKKVMVEFAHPNTHKEFHIGHLRNISIGESLVRTLGAAGAKMFRANYEGDVGLHVAKAIWGVREKIRKDKLHLPAGEAGISALRELNPANKAKFLGEGYALGSKVYDENETVKKEIIDLNKAIYQDPKQVELWEETRGWSLEYFDTVYHRVGTHFDRLFFESEVEAKGKQIVKDNIKTGIFIHDKDGSIYFPGEKYGLNNCVFVTKEDYATYEGKEVALEELEFKTFAFDLDLHVVANEQQNFFQIAFAAVEKLFPAQKGRQYHLPYGMVNMKGGKLSSRTGQVITADSLFDQAKLKILAIIKQSNNRTIEQLSGKEAEETAEKVAVAAVKYSMLRVNPRMDIAFDLAESVSFEGDSGPYLMYTYARARSVLRKSKIKYQKSKVKTLDLDAGDPSTSLRVNALAPSLRGGRTRKLEFNPEELAILRTLYRFPEVVVESAKNLSPNLLCSFLFDLAAKYNLFYNKHSILNATMEQSSNETMKKTSVNQDMVNFRLVLTQATAIILSRGLHLLGIETVERM